MNAARRAATRNPDELPCIWVTAGVLSYRLCDRGYRCEDCELFHALAGPAAQPPESEPISPRASRLGCPTAPSDEPETEGQVTAYLSRLVAGCKLYLDRAYSPHHFWLAREPGDEIRLGLDEQFLRILYPIDEIVTPRVGLRLKRGEPCGWISRGVRAIPLAAPISAAVKAVNPHYVDAISACLAIDDSDAWLMRIEPLEPLESVSDLFRDEGIMIFYLQKIRVLKRYLEECVPLDRGQNLGLTLADGGAHEPNLEEVLGSERYEKLLDEIA